MLYSFFSNCQTTKGKGQNKEDTRDNNISTCPCVRADKIYIRANSEHTKHIYYYMQIRIKKIAEISLYFLFIISGLI